jgi:tRNA 2-thiouridine synthesizing protein A
MHVGRPVCPRPGRELGNGSGAVRRMNHLRRQLDLRGVRCPLSWAKARVVLDTLERGEELDLLLDDPQAARDIPRAAEAVGHHVVSVEAGDGGWRITIEV